MRKHLIYLLLVFTVAFSQQAFAQIVPPSGCQKALQVDTCRRDCEKTNKKIDAVSFAGCKSVCNHDYNVCKALCSEPRAVCVSKCATKTGSDAAACRKSCGTEEDLKKYQTCLKK